MYNVVYLDIFRFTNIGTDICYKPTPFARSAGYREVSFTIFNHSLSHPSSNSTFRSLYSCFNLCIPPSILPFLILSFHSFHSILPFLLPILLKFLLPSFNSSFHPSIPPSILQFPLPSFNSPFHPSIPPSILEFLLPSFNSYFHPSIPPSILQFLLSSLNSSFNSSIFLWIIKIVIKQILRVDKLFS